MKVLIAEDNPMWATLLAENARQWKLQPIVVADGHEAIETWRNDPSICLVVLDWQMPGLSGIEVCQQIKSDSSRPFTYVMMLTSRDAKEDLVAGLDAGADNYLTKPVDMSVMKSQLTAAKRIVQAIPPKEWTRPRIDGYEVENVIGKGAFATVWQAIRESDGKPVAVKILRVDMAAPGVLKRFAREVEIMRSLDHPNITRIYDSCIDDQMGYFVMDLVDGGTLNEFEKRKSPTGTERIEIVRKICDGLNHAHEKSVIHRDLKFSNIMMTVGGDPKIVDFGMSKSMFEPVNDDPLKTMEGSVMGTPLFMSPEQARGEVSRLDGRSDLYSAAVILYILLLKRHPHAITKNDNASIIQAISTTEPRLPTTIKAKFNLDLEQILMRALAFDPDDRYQTAGEFGLDLQRFLNNRVGR